MGTLRVGTFNLLHGVAMTAPTAAPGEAGARSWSGPPPAEPELLARAAAEVDADVLGLQEVDRGQERSRSADQTAVVAEALGAPHWRFVPALLGTPGGTRSWTVATDDDHDAAGPTYGIGLVSRLPVLRWEVRRFASAPFSIPLVVPGNPRPQVVRVPDEPRVALAAVVDGPAGPFTVVTAHLSFVPGFNVRQLRAVTRWAASMPQPVLIAGDFNLPGNVPRRVTGWTSLVRAATYPSVRPKLQLDHVLARGIGTADVAATRSLALGVSDHCALTVDLRLPR